LADISAGAELMHQLSSNMGGWQGLEASKIAKMMVLKKWKSKVYG